VGSLFEDFRMIYAKLIFKMLFTKLVVHLPAII